MTGSPVPETEPNVPRRSGLRALLPIGLPLWDEGRGQRRRAVLAVMAVPSPIELE